MALGTYAQLQTAIAGWLSRNDLTAAIPDFIRLAEARFNRELRVQDMVTSVTDVFASAQVEKPDDFEQVSVFRLATSPVAVLTPIDAAEGYRLYSATIGQPRFYTIEGGDLTVFPTPGGQTYTLSYFAKVPALTTSNTVNWLLTRAPDLYLFASLVEAEPYLLNEERVPLWEAKYQGGKASLYAADRRARIHAGPVAARVA